MTKTAEAAPPAERFLGGRVIVRQTAGGYRAGLDSVLLGCAVALKPGERAVELGCGAGTALLIAAWRNREAAFLGLERDAETAAVAAQNVQANGWSDRVAVERADVLTTAADRREAFAHAFANPPFYDDPTAVRAPRDPARRAAFVGEEGGLLAWAGAALALVPTRGRVTFVHRADRLGDLLAALDARAGDVRIRPVQPRAEAPAKRVLVQARKGSRTPLTLLPALVLHGETGALTPQAAAIVEEGAALSFSA